VLGNQRRIQILDEHITAIDRLTPLLQRRVDAGASSPAETGRAQVASDLVKADRERVRAAFASARRELAVLMGDTSPKYSAVSGKLEAVGRPSSFQSVITAIDANPQLVWTAYRNVTPASDGTPQAYPDVRLSAGWRHFNDTGDDAVRLASDPHPVSDRNQGNIISAEALRDPCGTGKTAPRCSRAALTIVVWRAARTHPAIHDPEIARRLMRSPKDMGKGASACWRSSTRRPA
jgi:cobalt-zinc-cadmium efflux system outer membrane protein